jgi:eukaryotic-like serine/threonine-protein kinase
MREAPPYLLDHPWMSDAPDLPADELYKSRLQLSGEEADLLKAPREKNARYVDPIGRIDARYAGPWLAAYAPVGTTGWIAIVQEDRQAALHPVNALRSVFVRYGLSALAAVVLVFALLWLLLRRASR